MKKLLLATSTLAVATPAMAELTLSGNIVAKATTVDADELTDAVVTTLTLKATYENDAGAGGHMIFGQTDTSDTVNWTDTDILGFNVYANTAYGKFQIGTGAGEFTDGGLVIVRSLGDDVTNVEFPGYDGEVPMDGELDNEDDRDSTDVYLAYSYTSGDTTGQVSWGDDATLLSLSTVAGGFTVKLDALSYGESGDEDAVDPNVVNISGDLGPIQVALESGYSLISEENDGTDLSLAYTLGDLTAKVGTSTNGTEGTDVQEFMISGKAGNADYAFSTGSDEALTNEEDFSKVTLESMLSGMTAGISSNDRDGTTETELYIKPVDALEIEYVDNDGAEDAVINFKVSASF